MYLKKMFIRNLKKSTKKQNLGNKYIEKNYLIKLIGTKII